MKVCILILVVAIAGANANSGIIEEIKNQFKAVMSGFKQTEDLLIPFALEKGKELIKGAFTDSLSKINKLIVDNLIHSLGKRDLSQIVEEGEKLKTELENLVLLGQHQFNEVIEETMAEMKDIHDKVTNLVMHPDVAIHKLEQLMEKHTHLSKEFLQALERDANMIVSHFTKDSKRSFTENLHSTVQSLLDAFQPKLDQITSIMQGTKEVVKAYSANVMTALKTALTQLGQNMAAHTQELAGKGVDTLKELTKAAAEILGKASENVKPVFNHMIDSTKDVGTDFLANVG